MRLHSLVGRVVRVAQGEERAPRRFRAPLVARVNAWLMLPDSNQICLDAQVAGKRFLARQRGRRVALLRGLASQRRRRPGRRRRRRRGRRRLAVARREGRKLREYRRGNALVDREQQPRAAVRGDVPAQQASCA